MQVMIEWFEGEEGKVGIVYLDHLLHCRIEVAESGHSLTPLEGHSSFRTLTDAQRNAVSDLVAIYQAGQRGACRCFMSTE